MQPAVWREWGMAVVRMLEFGLALICWLMASSACAAEYVIAGPSSASLSTPAVYSAVSLDPFASSRFAGMWGNPAYGTFRDPDRPPGVPIYDGADGENVSLRLWFIGVDMSGVELGSRALLGAVNVGQPDPCHATHAAMWAYWTQLNGRAYNFKPVQMDAAGYMGYGPDRGWNPSRSDPPVAIENIFDLVLEFAPAASAGELRVYAFEKRYYSTDTYHYAPGRWIPAHYAWGLDPDEAENPMIKDPVGTAPQNRYYNRFAGYPYAQSMNVFAGFRCGGSADQVSWTRIKAEGTLCEPNSVNTIAGAKKAWIGGYYDIGMTRITADFRSRDGLIFVRQLDGSSAIGIKPDGVTLPPQINIGDRLQATGYTKLQDGAELILVADQITISPADPQDPPITPIGMTGLSSGGGAFGWQPGVVNDVLAPPPSAAAGLNTMGQLVRIWGEVTGAAQFQEQGDTIDACWLDDGGKLYDGFAGDPSVTGIRVIQPSDWTGDPPSGYYGIAGIMRPVLSPQGKVVRSLFPRSMADAIQCAPLFSDAAH